jgi:hypothetical protein
VKTWASRVRPFGCWIRLEPARRRFLTVGAKETSGWEIHRGSGTGRFDGAGGYTIEWTLTDEGEPGRSDGWSIVVRDPAGQVVLSEDGSLNGGNHQAHAR